MNSQDNVLINTEQRLFYISDDISNETIGKINFNLLYLLNKDEEQEKQQKNFKREPIHMFINSRGGEVYDMWSLIDIMLTSKTPIYTYCTGYALSAGFKIFLAGSKRFATYHALFMYHQAEGFYGIGKFQDTIELGNHFATIQDRIEEYVIDRTKIPANFIEENRIQKKNWYMYTDEALKCGIVTDIINVGDNICSI